MNFYQTKPCLCEGAVIDKDYACRCFCIGCWDDSVDRCICQYGCTCNDHLLRRLPK